MCIKMMKFLGWAGCLAAVCVLLWPQYVKLAEKRLAAGAFETLDEAAETCPARLSEKALFSPASVLTGGELAEPGVYVTPFFEYSFSREMPCFLEVYRVTDDGEVLYALAVSGEGEGTPSKFCYAYTPLGRSVCSYARKQGFISDP